MNLSSTWQDTSCKRSKKLYKGVDSRWQFLQGTLQGVKHRRRDHTPIEIKKTEALEGFIDKIDHV